MIATGTTIVPRRGPLLACLPPVGLSRESVGVFVELTDQEGHPVHVAVGQIVALVPHTEDGRQITQIITTATAGCEPYYVFVMMSIEQVIARIEDVTGRPYIMVH